MIVDWRTHEEECGTCGYPRLRSGAHAPYCIEGAFMIRDEERPRWARPLERILRLLHAA